MTPADTMRAAVEALERDIMNIPDGIQPNAPDVEFMRGFRFGHRAARHAAAELVLASIHPDTPIEAGKVGVASGVPDAEVLRKALRRAFSLGQTYWQQADSESLRQQELSNKTQAMFDKLIEDTVAAAGGESK